MCTRGYARGLGKHESKRAKPRAENEIIMNELTLQQENCNHEFVEIESQFSNDKFVEVKCAKCGVVGEKNVATGEVFYPAT